MQIGLITLQVATRKHPAIIVGSAVIMVIQIGDKLPSVHVYEKSPKNRVNIAELFSDKKAILFAIPAAFSPGCTRMHVPGYVKHYADLKAKGIDMVACVAVNDPFVMNAFGKSTDPEGQIRMLADPVANFTKAIGMDMDMSDVMGGTRSKRYSMLIINGVVKQINLEPDNFGLSVSLAPELLSKL